MALSVVGSERLPDSGYLRAKMAQEKLIEDSPIPYSIVHATQFFEFVGRIADAATGGNTVRLAHVLIQPMAAEDVASAVADVTAGPPLNGVTEIAGPQQFPDKAGKSGRALCRSRPAQGPAATHQFQLAARRHVHLRRTTGPAIR